VNTNNGVKWRGFIVPNKVEQIKDHLFIDTYNNDAFIKAKIKTLNKRSCSRGNKMNKNTNKEHLEIYATSRNEHKL